MEKIILFIFIISFITQIFYYLFFYARIIFNIKNNKTKNTKEKEVSVIICAKNEENNIKKNLINILEQNYSNYEVIVVNDSSTDNSEKVLEKLKEKYPHLYTTFIKKTHFVHTKKLPLTLGIKAAKYEYILLTDADCFVASKDWITKIQENFDEKTEFILAYSGYEKTKGFLNKLIRFDTLFIALQYFTFAMAKIPYMGVGRNLAYRKSSFFKNKGFEKHLDLMSGDDDLYVNEFANAKNIKIELDEETFTYSKTKETFRKWFSQKRRHFLTGKRYKLKHKILLGGEILSRILFYILFIILLIWHFQITLIFLFFGIRFLIQQIILFFATKRFKEKDLLYFGFFFDVLLLMNNILVVISNILKKKRRWI